MLFPPSHTPTLSTPTLRSVDRLDSIFFTGPPLEEGPLPAIFYFALTGEQSLTLSPINAPAAFLNLKNVRTFSWSLFAHREEVDSKESIKQWTQALKEELNFVEAFIKKAKSVLDFLLENQWVLPEAVAVCGLSRGGFLASHWAAQDSRVLAVVAYAPLINVHTRGLFAELSNSTLAQSLDLLHLKEKLTHKHICYYTGNNDQMTGTLPVMELVKSISHCAHLQRIRSPDIQLIVTPSIGHKGHGTAPHVFYSGTEYIMEFFSSRGIAL